MRILSWNVNGIRAAHRHGFLEWLKGDFPDILCIQEAKANPRQVPPELRHPYSYKSYWSFAEKKGYAGVTTFVQKEPINVKYGLGINIFDREGRVLTTDYPSFTLVNVYVPHGDRDQSKLPHKLAFYDVFLKYLSELKNKNVVICGDFNIAHSELDLERPKNNIGNTMFLPEERVYLDKIIDLGFIDTFRTLNKEGRHYTWWPYFANARQRNLGWRIDYVFVSKNLESKVKDAFILNKVMGSDHCPIGIELDL